VLAIVLDPATHQHSWMGRNHMSKASTLGNLQNGNKLKRLVVGQLPKQLARAQKWGCEFRRMLESEVIATHGEVTTMAAHYIDAAVNDEVCTSVVRWLLQQRLEKMDTVTILACLDRLVKFRHSRNQQVEKLKLDADQQTDLMTTLYLPPHELADAKAPSSPPDASGTSTTPESSTDVQTPENASSESAAYPTTISER
jgi:hypothetical protein